jgi:hypothetical protein
LPAGLVRRGVARRRVGDHLRGTRRQHSFSYGSIRGGKALELRRGLDRGPDLSGRDAERVCDRLRPEADVRVAVDRALGGLGRHPVDNTPDHAQLVDDPQRRLRRQRRRVEVARDPVQGTASRSEGIEHLFATVTVRCDTEIVERR